MASTKENSTAIQGTQNIAAKKGRLQRFTPFVVLGLACLAAFWLGITRREIAPNAGLVVEETGLNFGEVWENPDFEWKLSVINQSAEKVRVVDFATSCGCVTVEPNALVFEPYQEKKLHLTLDLTAITIRQNSNVQGVRPFIVKITPRIQGIDAKSQVWSIHGRVKKTISVDPRAISFGESLIQGQPTVSRTIQVEAHAELKGLKIEINDPNLADIAVQSISQRPQRYNVVIKPRQNLPLGVFKINVAIRPILTTKEELSPIVVPIHGRVMQDIQAIPSNVILGAHTVGTAVEEQVVLRSWSKAAFRVERIEGDSKHIELMDVQDIPDGKLLRIKHSIAAVGNQTANVQIIVTDGNGKRIPIPLFLTYLGKAK